MIKLKILPEKQYRSYFYLSEEQHTAYYNEHTFDYLVDRCPEHRNKPPFRDAESIRFLKETYNIRFVENDWYSILDVYNERTSIFELNSAMRYALAVIYYSRQGYYLNLKSAEATIWRVLADLPFDVLIYSSMEEICEYYQVCDGVEYVIENYPYQGRELEVTIKDMIKYDDPFYKRVSEDHVLDTSYGLYIGTDGKYYSEDISLSYAFGYFWKSHIEDILTYIEEYLGKHKEPIYLMKTVQTMNIFQFQKLLGASDYETIEEGGDNYLWLRDELKIVNHMVQMPESASSRKLPYMFVDKNKDGSYYLSGSLTVKYPSYCEILREVVDMCQNMKQEERYVLVVDVEERLHRDEDIKETLCGFKITRNRIDTFSPREAIEVVGNAMKEAYYSGNCTVSTEFY